MILNSPYISGSLTVTGNTTIQGQLTVTGSLSGTASLASNALLLQGTGSTGFATTSSLLEVSSSQQQISSSQQQISSSYIALSASYNTFSGSASTRVTQIEQVYATTGSNSFRATQSITGSLTVTGQIIAQTINVQQVTSSIIYSSGSNVFGCDINSRQTFTGSFYQTGSLASFSGQLCVGSSLVLGTNNAYALYLRDSAGNPKPVMATAGNTNLNFYNICSTGKVNINNAADNAVLMSIDNTGAATFSGQLCSITGVFGTKGGGNYGVLISDNDQSNVRLKFTNTGTGGTSMSIVGGNPGLSNSGLAIYDETNAATRLYVSANGNVGIGTSSPANKLQVNSTSGDGMFLTSYLTTTGAADTGAILGFGIYDGVNNRDAAIIKGLKENGTSGNYAAYLSFSTRPDGGSVTERMRITSAGSVGIGTIVSTAGLGIGGTGQTTANLTDAGCRSGIIEIIPVGGEAGNGGALVLGSDTWGTGVGRGQVALKALLTDGSGCGVSDLAFSLRNNSACSNLTERMRITSCGKVGIIATDPKWLLEICCNTTATGGGGYPAISINNPNDAGYSALYFFKGANNFGGLELSNATCHLFINTACTFAIQTTGVERMRVTSCGAIAIGRNDVPYTNYKLMVKVATDRTIAFGTQGTDASIEAANDLFSANVPLRIYGSPFYLPNIYADTTGTGANVVVGTDGRMQRSTSSSKYKNNVQDYTKGLVEVMQMRPVIYNSKNEDETQTYAGLIAEEIHELGLTEFVQYAEDNTPDALSYGNMVSLLVKAIQELKAEIDELKNNTI